MKSHLIRLVTLFMIIGCGDDQEPYSQRLVFETHKHAIRNGTREPQVLALNDAQKRAIGWLHPQGVPDRPFCTGTLVSPRVVATASHCIEGRQGRRIAFGVGLMPNNAENSFTVVEAIAHPQLDAAILILGENATTAEPVIEPIPFNRETPSRAIVGTEVEAAGYGETYDVSREGRYFAVVQLIAIQGTTLVVDGRGRQGICFGDSGGPVMNTDAQGATRVMGVESWGDPSCLGVDHLTRLDVIAEWIDGRVADYLQDELSPECRAAGISGRCQGEIFERCEEGELIRRDCAEEGLRCRRNQGVPGSDCGEPDLCEVVGSAGACDGNVVQRCRFGEIELTDCAEQNLICQLDEGGAFCALEPGSDEWEEQADTNADEDGIDATGGRMTDEADDAEERSSDLSALSDVEGRNDVQPESAGNDEIIPAPDGEQRKSSGCQAGRPSTSGPAPVSVGLSLILLGFWRRRIWRRVPI